MLRLAEESVDLKCCVPSTVLVLPVHMATALSFATLSTLGEGVAPNPVAGSYGAHPRRRTLPWVSVGALASEEVRMIMGLDAVGWTALGTVGLVGITAVYVWLTWRVVNSAESSALTAERSAVASEQAAATSALSAKASERSAEVAEQSLRLQVMPLLIGDQALMSGGKTTIRIRGRGDAFTVVATVRQGDEAGSSGVVAYVDPTTTQSLTIDPGFVVDHTRHYVVEVEYTDAFGRGYRTTRESLLEGQSIVRIECYEAGVWTSLGA